MYFKFFYKLLVGFSGEEVGVATQVKIGNQLTRRGQVGGPSESWSARAMAADTAASVTAASVSATVAKVRPSSCEEAPPGRGAEAPFCRMD